MNEEKNQLQKVTTARQLITSDYFVGEVAKVLPRHIRPTRFVRCVETQMRLQPKLMLCDPPHFALRVLQMAQMGLEPDGRRAHLVPFKNNKKSNAAGKDVYDCTLIVGYQGLSELATNTGDVANIHADTVCRGDKFVYTKGQLVTHEIDWENFDDRGPMYAAYATIRFKDGTEKTEVMAKSEILKARDASSGYQAFLKGYTKDTPWLTSEGEMWKKTAFRRACKWIKLSPEIRDNLEAEDTPAPAAIHADAIDLDTNTEPDSNEPEPEEGLEQPEEKQSRKGRPRGSRNKPKQTETEPEDDVPMDNPEPGTMTEAKSIQDQVADIVTGYGYTFDDFLGWAAKEGLFETSATSFDELEESICKRMLNAKQGLLNGLKQFTGK